MRRNTKACLAVLTLIAILNASCSKIDFIKHEDDKLSNHVIIQWNLVALQAEGGVTYANPLTSTRANAMVHIAMHDALNAINPIYYQYVFKTNHKTIADPVAAASNAAYTVLLANFPEYKSKLDSALEANLAKVEDGFLKQQGLILGRKAAEAILALRAGDGAYDDPVVFIPVSDVPGVYNVVPPFDFLFGPQWKTMQLFSLKTHDQFRSVPPPALNSVRYALDYNEVKAVGKVNSAFRTEDQSAYAKWWYEFVEIGWNRLARIKAKEHHTGLYTTARLFALLNMAVMDSYIAGFDSKNYYNFWRPYTAIRAGATDGNIATIADPAWEPAEPTPPVQDYPSTHSVGGNAAATVMTYFYGQHEGFSMTSSTGVPPSTIRSFKSFHEAADENADSRVMAGIHFRFATVAGQKMGDLVGDWTLHHHLKPRK